MSALADKEAEADFVRAAIALAEESPGRFNAESAADGVSEFCFTDVFLWSVYSQVKALARSGETLTQQALSAALGPELRDRVSSVWPVVGVFSGYRSLSARLRDYAQRRAADAIGQRIREAARDNAGKFSQALVEAAAALQGAFSSDGTSIIDGTAVLMDFLDRLERVQQGTEEMCIPTGLAAWDACLGGLPRKFVTLIGAYPGCFKSGICATIAGNLAYSGRKVGFFSLEDNAEWVAKRFVSAKTGIPVEDMGRRKLKQYELENLSDAGEVVDKVMRNMHFDHRSGLTGAELAASARFMVSECKVDAIIVDHIGETRPMDKSKEKHQWLGENFLMLRDVAKDCNVAILCAAHLRRKDDSDEDIHRVPRMTDFSDSSQLEKACRVALGLYQPRDHPDEVGLKVLKQNEGGARGVEFNLRKRAKCAMVE